MMLRVENRTSSDSCAAIGPSRTYSALVQTGALVSWVNIESERRPLKPGVEKARVPR